MSRGTDLNKKMQTKGHTSTSAQKKMRKEMHAWKHGLTWLGLREKIT